MNCLFYVKHKLGGKVTPVFDVKVNISIEFLVYDKKDGWKYVSAVYFEPIVEKEGEQK